MDKKTTRDALSDASGTADTGGYPRAEDFTKILIAKLTEEVYKHIAGREEGGVDLGPRGLILTSSVGQVVPCLSHQVSG